MDIDSSHRSRLSFRTRLACQSWCFTSPPTNGLKSRMVTFAARLTNTTSASFATTHRKHVADVKVVPHLPGECITMKSSAYDAKTYYADEVTACRTTYHGTGERGAVAHSIAQTAVITAIVAQRDAQNKQKVPDEGAHWSAMTASTSQYDP